MSQSPDEAVEIGREHPYAQAARQLNKLVRLGHSFSGHERNCCFLNVRGGRFANVSAVSGIDFPDDGRAVVRSDWDLDGDLDFWVANRTAPRVRFLRNELATDHHFLRFRLVGTTSNRDAIGARVTIGFPEDLNDEIHGGSDRSGRMLSQSVRAGEGFLGQSSKWVHFGLGAADRIEQLEVRWPSGTVERFAVPAEVDACYRLVEGTGKTEWCPPPATSEPPGRKDLQAHAVPAASDTSHHFLSQSAPLPPLVFALLEGATDGEPVDATRPTGAPVLLNIWATWCGPCGVELAEFARRADELEQHNVRVIALSVDGASGHDAGSVTAVREFLQAINFPHTGGLAAPELLDRLQLVNNMIYRDDHRRLPVPTSLLIDGQGRLAALYKGRVSVDRLLRDVGRLASYGQDEHQERLDESLPFVGRWLGPPGPHGAVRLAADLWDHGFGQDALELADRLPLPEYRRQQIEMHWLNAVRLRSQGDVTAALVQLRAVLELEPDHPDAHMEVGTILAERGDLDAALAHLERAVDRFDPPRADAYVNLGTALRKLRRLDEAETRLEQALSIDLDLAAAHAGLGLVRAAQKRFVEAAASFAHAARLDEKDIQSRLNLATAWISAGDVQRALAPLAEAQRLEPDSVVVLTYLGQVRAELGQIVAAIEHFSRVVALQPDASKVWFRLAELHEKQGDLTAALDHYRQAARLVPGNELVESRIDRILSAAPDEKKVEK